MRIQLNDSHFQILGVTQLSTKDEIKKAYRDKIKMWHPDKFFNCPEKIAEAVEISKKINDAFALLKNYEPPKNSELNSSFKKYNGNHTTSNFAKRTSSPKEARLNILRIRVKSSNIHSVGYDKLHKVLQVEFLNGSIYQFYDVPENIYKNILKADSKGKYFNCNVSGRFRYECV